MAFPDRMQKAGDRLVRHFGGGATCTVKLYEAEVPDVATGSTTRGAATTIADVPFTSMPLMDKEFEAQRAGDQLVMLSGSALGSYRLDSYHATILLPGETEELKIVVPTERDDPDNATPAGWAVLVRRGGSAR